MDKKLRSLFKGKRATVVTRDGDVIRVVYHWTTVATIDLLAETVRFNTGGWETVTTKARINDIARALGLRATLFQQKFVWQWAMHGQWDNPIRHTDGITFNYATNEIV